MNGRYNVLYEPCITVKSMSGDLQKIGILECLENSHQIKEIIPYNGAMITKFAILYLLQMIIYDIYRPKNDDLHGNDLAKMKKAGKFDPDSLEEYFTKTVDIEAFDLFGENKAFAQFAADEMPDKCGIRKVGFINPMARRDSNDVFYGRVDSKKYYSYHNLPETKLDYKYSSRTAYTKIQNASFEEYFIILLLSMFYLGANGRGWQCSLLRNLATLATINGKNLFETIIFNMISTDIDYDDSKPFYRRERYSEFQDNLKLANMKNNGKIPIFKFLLTPYNFIRYKTVDFENQIVEDIYLKHGENPREIFIDKDGKEKKKPKDTDQLSKDWGRHYCPNTVKVYSKTENVIVMPPEIADEGFLQLYEYCDVNPGIYGIKTLKENRDLLDKFSLEIVGFKIASSSVIECEVYHHFTDLSREVFEPEVYNKLKTILLIIKDIDIRLRNRTFNVLYPKAENTEPNKNGAVFVTTVRRNFISDCELKMMYGANSWKSRIINGEEINDICTEIKRLATKCFSYLVVNESSNLMTALYQDKWFRADINKVLKERM